MGRDTKKRVVERIDKYQNRISRILEFTCFIMLLSMVISITLAVIFRYLFFFPLNFSDQVSKYLLIWIAFVGSGIVAASDEHITVEFLVQRLPAKIERILKIIGNTIILGFAIFIIYYGSLYALNGLRSKDPLVFNLSLFVPYLSVPVGFFAISLQVLLNTVKIFFTECSKSGEGEAV